MYKKLLIQQVRYTNGTYVGDEPVVDTQETFKIVCKEIPFKALPETDEPASRTWNDQDGEDFYIPKRGLRKKAYDIDVEFLYVNDGSGYTEQSGSYDEWLATQMHNHILAFIKYIECVTAAGGGAVPEANGWCLAVYDEYTKIGIQGMYVKKIDTDLYYYSDTSSGAIASFKVTFRVADPTNFVELSAS